jgi:glycosyltransferase involved in cell wall biosynthesis
MHEAPSFDSLTIVIPTYNRRDILAKALEGYLAQSAPARIHELLVVDDGSTDDTESMVQEFGEKTPFPVRYLRQPNRGPAAARNFGIREAGSSLVLFTDSDIIPERGLVEQHVDWHRRNPEITVAVLGYVTWSPELGATPFMRWYGERGGLFKYHRLRGLVKAPFEFFYTCNLSLKTEFLRTFGQFDEDFKSAAFEDIELGYRLDKKGLQVMYNPTAVGYHYQFFSFASACHREQSKEPAGRIYLKKEAGKRALEDATAGFGGKYPALRRAVRQLAIALARILAPFRSLLDSKVPLPFIFYKLFLWYDVKNRNGFVDRSANSSNAI